MHDLLPDWKAMDADERLSMVRRMAAEGLSGGGIALRFRNATRMSVVGLCYRRGITLKGIAPKPPGPSKKPKARGNLNQPKVQAIVAKKLRMANEPAFETAPLPEEDLGNDVTALLGIMDLKADSCRWMFGDPKGQHGYCGKTTKAGSSWCPHHHDVVFPGGRP
jgi:hypothetical protein